MPSTVVILAKEDNDMTIHLPAEIEHSIQAAVHCGHFVGRVQQTAVIEIESVDVDVELHYGLTGISKGRPCGRPCCPTTEAVGGICKELYATMHHWSITIAVPHLDRFAIRCPYAV